MARNQLSNPDSLVGHIYKARYHPTSSFMDAMLKANLSLILRSILEAKNVIRSGARWRIGKGDRVMVWVDPWLSDMGNLWVESPPAEGHELATMESLKRLDGTGVGTMGLGPTTPANRPRPTEDHRMMA